MNEFQALHTWLLSTVKGELIIAVLGCLIFTILWKLAQKFTNWFITVVPSRYRTISRKGAVSRLATLERVNNNTYQLILQLVEQLCISIFAGFSSAVVIGGLVAGFVGRLSHEPKWGLVPLLSGFSLVDECIILVMMASLASFASGLLELYKDLTNYENTVLKLKRRIEEIDEARP